MEHTEEFFEKLLAFGPHWSVSNIDLSADKKCVELTLHHQNHGTVICPQCGDSCALHDHARERVWRHLNVLQYETRIRARIPRSSCSKCGVHQIEVPWSEPHSRLTFLFEDYCVEVLQAARSTTQACQLLRISWGTANAIMKRAVARGLERRSLETVKRIGIDEKSFLSHHNYITSLCDLDGGRVLDVTENRTQEAAVKLIKSLGDNTLGNIEAVAMDMWPAFLNAVKEVLPQAAIVHDRFHVSKHLNEGVNKVRTQEHKKLLSEGDNSLTGTRNLWLWNEENLSDAQYHRFKDIKESELKTSKAWFIKECFRYFWEVPKTREAAAEYFAEWYRHTICSKLEPMKKVARMLKEHLPNLLTWCEHRITNAVSEGLNSKIQSVKSAARGFHTFESYRTRILFFCGKLNMRIDTSHSI